jgi:hypothetical protein
LEVEWEIVLVKISIFADINVTTIGGIGKKKQNLKRRIMTK